MSKLFLLWDSSLDSTRFRSWGYKSLLRPPFGSLQQPRHHTHTYNRAFFRDLWRKNNNTFQTLSISPRTLLSFRFKEPGAWSIRFKCTNSKDVNHIVIIVIHTARNGKVICDLQGGLTDSYGISLLKVGRLMLHRRILNMNLVAKKTSISRTAQM